MNDFLKWQDQLTQDASTFTTSLVYEAKTLPTPQKGINMLKGLKQGFPDGYHGTVDEAIVNVLNNVVDDAIREVRKQALNKTWSDSDD